MSRYIDADKIQEAFKELHGGKRSLLIDTAPTADVRENAQGEWIVWGGMDVPENHGRHKCSECGEFALLKYEKPLRKEVLSDFCPACGADLRHREENNDDTNA